MKKTFKDEAVIGIERTGHLSPDIITEDDLKHLPPVVNKYLHYVGVVGKEKVHSMRALCKGKIRSNPGDSWMNLTSEQYNFFDDPTRIFYIRASKTRIPVVGLHLYKNVSASMTIKLLGLIKVVDARGPEMNQAETVTILNDMCLLAPATLISKNIQWEEVDSLSVRAKYTNGNITISAILYFNDKGEIVNFISNDRYALEGKTYKIYPWLSPIKGYTEINGIKLVSQASVEYQRPDTTFSYGEFTLKEVEYNCKEIK